MRYEVAAINANDDVPGGVARLLSLLRWKPTEKSYLIKPNMLNAKTSDEGVTTDPRIVKALIESLRNCGSKAYVGDSPGNAYPGKSLMVFKKTRMLDAIMESGGEYVDFEGQPPEIIKIDGVMIESMGIARPVFENRLINVPKLKTHMQTVMTGSIKNLVFGCVQGAGKGHIHEVGRSPDRMARAMADIYSVIRPRVEMNLMDAIIGMDGNGPSGGRAVKMGRLLAGRDALALDIAAFSMVGVKPEKVPYIKECMDRGLGPRSPDEIEILGDEPTLFRFKMPSTIVRSLTLFAGQFVGSVSPTISFDRSRCTKCGECEGICPTKAIKNKEYPVVDQSKCIKCFTCHEVCEYNAVRVKRKMIW